MQNNYLLEDSHQAKEQRQKVINLLLSGEVANQKIALKLLAGGGVPAQFWSYLVGLHYISSDSKYKLKKQIEQLMQANQLGQLAEILAEFSADKGSYVNGYDNEAEAFEGFLYEHHHRIFSEFSFLDKNTVAKTFLVLEKTALRFCLVHDAMPPKEALWHFIDQNSLNLSYQSLDYLPKEIGDFTNLEELDISENNLTDLPEGLANLKNLQRIYYYGNEFPSEVIERLEKTFPKIFADEYNNKAGQAYSRKNYEAANQNIDKALELYPQEANFWVTKGAILANLKQDYTTGIEYSQKAIPIIADNETIDIEKIEIATLAWANISGYYRRMGKDEQSLEAATKGMALYKQYPQVGSAREESLYFRKAQALYHLKRYSESLMVYQEALKKYPDHSSYYYNIACIYAKWQQKEEMMKYIKKVCKINPDYKEEMLQDIDFKEYWEDKDLLEIVK